MAWCKAVFIFNVVVRHTIGAGGPQTNSVGCIQQASTNQQCHSHFPEAFGISKCTGYAGVIDDTVVHPVAIHLLAHQLSFIGKGLPEFIVSEGYAFHCVTEWRVSNTIDAYGQVKFFTRAKITNYKWNVLGCTIFIHITIDCFTRIIGEEHGGCAGIACNLDLCHLGIKWQLNASYSPLNVHISAIENLEEQVAGFIVSDALAEVIDSEDSFNQFFDHKAIMQGI